MIHMSASEKKTVPVACTLDAAGAADQLDDWGRLQALCTRTEREANRATLWFDACAEESLRAVAEREAACCGFLDLDVRRVDDLVRLDISSESPGAQAVIELLVAQASGTSVQPGR